MTRPDRPQALPYFVKGDIDGFFGLALDNLVQLLLINALCKFVLGFPDDLLYTRMLPGVAVSLIIGNLYYAHQARRLALATNRRDVCALPYGINTPSVFAFVFLVMLPAKIAAEAANHPNPQLAAYHAGLVACLGSGVIEFAGAFIAERVRRAAPRAALLSTLSGIAIGFISISFLFRAYANPLVGLSTLSIILLAYFGRVRFKAHLPAGLIAVALGTALCWATGTAGQTTPTAAGFHPPLPVFSDIAAAFSSDYALTYLSVIIPMGLFNVVGSLQNIESSQAAGDSYPTAPSLAVNGVGTLLGGAFGSCFPTTIYIGHPGWKAMGARSGYSTLNALFITIICLTGTTAHVAYAVPIDAAMVIVLWIGIIITSQAFTATPQSHAPAVVIGLLPGLVAWVAVTIKTSLRIASEGALFGPAGVPDAPALLAAFQQNDIALHGVFALEQGFIFSAMILSAITVHVIERQFRKAAAWSAAAAVLTALGFMHAYRFTHTDTVLQLAVEPLWNPDAQWTFTHWPWVAAYTIMTLILLTAPYLTQPADQSAI